MSAATVGILRCGEPPEALRAEHGSYDDMVRRLLGPGREAEVFDATRPGGLPPVGAHAALVLTGSPAGVYDDLPWIPPLLAHLRAARGRARLVGLCFGHQAMAVAFGGRVVKSPKGWGVGVHRYAVVARANWMDDGDAREVRAPASHQDQVVEPPPGARVTLASDFTPFAGLDHGDAISFQFHPEFTPGFGRALVEATRDRYGARAAPALASYEGPSPTDNARVARWIGRFLDAPRRATGPDGRLESGGTARPARPPTLNPARG